MQAAQCVHILIQILGGDAKVSFSRRLDLTALGETFLGCIHILVCILHLIRERLLLEIIIVLGSCLLLCCGIKLPFRLVQKAIESVNNGTALAFIGRCFWGSSLLI